MSFDALRAALRGVAPVPIAPFAADGSLDEAGLARNLQAMLDSGISLLIPNGGTGEFQALTPAEAQRVTEIACTAAAGRARVVAGVGFDQASAIAAGRHAYSCGANGIMIHYPTHPYLSNQGVYDYLAGIAGALPDLGVVLYLKGPLPTVDLLGRLCQAHPNVVAIKWGMSDVALFATAREALRQQAPDVVWSCGIAERWAPFFFLAGAEGFTSGIANFAPQLSLDLLRALREQDWPAAMALRSKLNAFEDLRARHNNANNISAIKYAMNLLGMAAGGVRPPISALNEADQAEARSILNSWGLLG